MPNSKTINVNHVYITYEQFLGTKSIDVPLINYQLSNITDSNNNEFQLVTQYSHSWTNIDVACSYWTQRVKYSKYQQIMAFMSTKLHYIWDISNIREPKSLYTPKDVIRSIKFNDEYDFEFIANNLLLIYPVYTDEEEWFDRKPQTIYIYNFSQKQVIYSFIGEHKFGIKYDTHYNEISTNNKIILYFHSIDDETFTVHKYSLNFMKTQQTICKHENIVNVAKNMNKKVHHLTLTLSPNGLSLSLLVGMSKVFIMETITNEIIYYNILTSYYQRLFFKQIWMTTQCLLFIGTRSMDCSVCYALCDIRNDRFRIDFLSKYVQGNNDLISIILDMIRFERCDILLDQHINDLDYVSHLNYTYDDKECCLFVGCNRNTEIRKNLKKLYHFTV